MFRNSSFILIFHPASDDREAITTICQAAKCQNNKQNQDRKLNDVFKTRNTDGYKYVGWKLWYLCACLRRWCLAGANYRIMPKWCEIDRSSNWGNIRQSCFFFLHWLLVSPEINLWNWPYSNKIHSRLGGGNSEFPSEKFSETKGDLIKLPKFRRDAIGISNPSCKLFLPDTGILERVESSYTVEDEIRNTWKHFSPDFV